MEPETGGTYSITGDGIDIPYLTNVTIEAIPSEGYKFLRWEKNGVTETYSPDFTFPATENAEYIAHFEKLKFTVKLSVEPDDCWEVEGGGTFDFNSLITIKAIAAENFLFERWMCGDEELSKDSIYQLYVTENMDIIAFFIENVKINEIYSDIKIFPNPATSFFSISVPYEKISIYNSIAIMVLQEKNNKEIDISILPSGIYTVVIENKSSTILRLLTVIK